MRDWADLPPELIHIISNKLPDVTHFLRFRAVCKSWCSSAPLSDPPPQLPWLLECIPREALDSSLEEKLRFYSLSTDETGTLPVKQSHRGKSYHGPCSGYLILWEFQRQLWMWNPLSNADISYPLLHRPVFSLWPVWTGSDPILSRRIVFVDSNPDIIREMECWAVYRPGNTKWNIMEGFFYNSCYWNDMFFTTCGDTDTKVFDGTTQKLLYQIPSPEDVHGFWPKSYLVEISGVIMRVCMHLSWHQKVVDAIFQFYELRFEGRNHKPSWVKVKDIGNHMLFLDLNSGFSLKPIAGFKGNCIYFLSYYDSTPCRYDIATGTFQRVPCPFEICTWFLPSLC